MDWERFAGACEMRTVVGGLCGVDDSVLKHPAGTYRAAMVRVFNPAARLWSIWWIDGRNPSLEPPVHGCFEDGVGAFLGDDVLDSRPTRVRFVWSAITARSARWEQAFSADGRASWEDNWVEDFERTAS